MKTNETKGTQAPPVGRPSDPVKDSGIPGEEMLVACERISSERYQAFIENIEEGVYEVDLQGNFLYFNNSLCKLFGYPREDIQFHNFSKFMDEDYAKRTFDAFNNVYKCGRGFTDLIWKIRDKHHHERIIELSANLIRDEKGERIGFRGIARDITEKFKTQEALLISERRFRALFDFAPYAIVVFTLDGRVSYLNPAFTETFGWTLRELEGKTIPYVPKGLEEETRENIHRLLEQRLILSYESQRLTKDGRSLDVAMRAVVFSEDEGRPSGELVMLRDITQEKRIARNNAALLRISLALPEYPHLEGLLDYISGEIKGLLGVEGALVILLDEENNELFFQAAAYDDVATGQRFKEIRFPASKGVSGKVIRTGKPVVVPDTSKDPDFYGVVDIQAGFKTRSMLDVPLRNKDRIIGVLCAMNKKVGDFDDLDIELLNMISGTVVLSVENARYSKELKEAYKEVSSLNRAKDRVINHLSHELRTPLSVLSASLNILSKKLSRLAEDTWQSTIERAKRNLDRILEMQYQVEDIMRERHYHPHALLSILVEECKDVLEALAAEEVGEVPLIQNIHRRIEDIFGVKETAPTEVFLDQFVSKTLDEIRPLFSHRNVALETRFAPSPVIKMPLDPLKKVVVGLIRNAIENTPDEGKIEILVGKQGSGVGLVVRDYGVGITPQNQRRIFEGFFTTREPMDYSSKRPFDFNAGGKGSDLLRMKIFSERYDFKIHMTSSRCKHIPLDKDVCPGTITECHFCEQYGACHRSGGTTFTVIFPPASEEREGFPQDKGTEPI